MPIPKPKPDEKEDAYVGRCMEAIGGEYEDKDQALAVCYSQYRDSRKKEMNEQLLEAIRQRQAQKSEFGYGIVTADRYAKNVLDAVGLEVAYKCAATRTISWDDVMKKAARTLVYSNPDMVTEEIEYSRRAGSSLKKLDDIELPKNCLMVFRHVLTTPRKDRDGDVLRTGGAKVDPKMILLWNHVHTLPIGKMLAVSEHNSKKLSLVSCIVDMNDLSHDCAVMIDNGMGRFSHGFRAIDFSRTKEPDEGDEKAQREGSSGFDVKEFEIMEESLVTVPSNTDAEVEEVMLGLVEGGKMTSTIMKEYGKTIREHRPKQFAGGLDFSKISLPIDLKITLNGKEIEDADLSGDGGGSAEGTEREREERKDQAGLDQKADDEGRDKAEEATTDEEIACPECGEMMPRSEGAECPKCGYVLKKSDMGEEDEEEMIAEEKSKAEKIVEKWDGKSVETLLDMIAKEIGGGWLLKDGEPVVKSGRTISRGNLAMLKEVHADVDELDRGNHVLSVKGRELCGRANKKLKGFIDSWDVDQAAEMPKSFSIEDAMAVVIADASSSQRATIRKAFDAIEQVEMQNADAKQYRALVGS